MGGLRAAQEGGSRRRCHGTQRQQQPHHQHSPTHQKHTSVHGKRRSHVSRWEEKVAAPTIRKNTVLARRRAAPRASPFSSPSLSTPSQNIQRNRCGKCDIRGYQKQSRPLAQHHVFVRSRRECNELMFSEAVVLRQRGPFRWTSIFLWYQGQLVVHSFAVALPEMVD